MCARSRRSVNTRIYVSDGEPDLWQTAKNKYQTETCTDEIEVKTKQKHKNKWRSRQDLDLVMQTVIEKNRFSFVNGKKLKGKKKI